MKRLFILFAVVALFVSFPRVALGEDCSGDENARRACLERQIAEYEQQVKTLQAKATTLNNQIAQFNAQIKLTELKIAQTEEQANLLSGRMSQLSDSLSKLSNAFESRVVETYKLSRVGDTPFALFLAGRVNEALSTYYYLKQIQQADHGLIGRLAKASDTYKQQKTELEALQKNLATQKSNLDQQRKAKNQLLSVTQNDEKKYHQLLASSRAEYEAIQAIIAGKGDESEAGKVSSGQKIASIIQGASCNSSAAHLHFIVAKGKVAENPFSYLKPGIDSQNCSGPGECSPGDPFNPTGSWNWPISPTIRYSQGFGRTWAVANTWVGRVYSQHNGIDINSTSSNEVRSVSAGTLYRGSYTGGGGCRLRYVRVHHDGSDIDTFYLHINY
jgi:peptidoglycan hydrolase CwlO-like protein